MEGNNSMTTNMSNLLKSKIDVLLAVPHCCPELKEAAKKYIEAIGTNDEHNQAISFVNELEEDVLPIDSLIEFSTSEYAINMFGKESAEAMNLNAIKAKESGEKYCICDACQAGKELILLKDEILKY